MTETLVVVEPPSQDPDRRALSAAELFDVVVVNRDRGAGSVGASSSRGRAGGRRSPVACVGGRSRSGCAIHRHRRAGRPPTIGSRHTQRSALPQRAAPVVQVCVQAASRFSRSAPVAHPPSTEVVGDIIPIGFVRAFTARLTSRDVAGVALQPVCGRPRVSLVMASGSLCSLGFYRSLQHLFFQGSRRRRGPRS
jgi:hypothetical protein